MAVQRCHDFSGGDGEAFCPPLAPHRGRRLLIYYSHQTGNMLSFAANLAALSRETYATHSFTALISDIHGTGTPYHKVPFVLGVFLALA